MIYSLVISVLILGIAAFFGFQQKERLVKLEEEWLVLSARGEGYDIPLDPAREYAPGRLGNRAPKAANTEEVMAFSNKLKSFMKEMKEAEKAGGGNQLEMQQRGMKLISEMLNFSPADIQLLVDDLMADESIDEDSKNELVMMSIMMLSQEQPEMALAMILETKERFMKSDQMKTHFLSTALAQLAKRDPQAALEWISTHRDDIGEVDDSLRKEILVAAASKDIKSAFGLIGEMNFDNLSGACRSIAHSTTPESIEDFVAGIREYESDEAATEAGFNGLASSPFVEDTEKAIAFLNEGKLTPDEQKIFLDGLGYHTLKEDTGRWLNWMAKKKKMDSNGKKIIREWTRSDFEAAGEWINTLEKGKPRDEAVLTYAGTLAEHEPQAADVWAESLSLGPVQNSLRKDIYRQIRRKDQAAAAAYAEKYSIAQ
jgi:hypothetical protein